MYSNLKHKTHTQMINRLFVSNFKYIKSTCSIFMLNFQILTVHLLRRLIERAALSSPRLPDAATGVRSARSRPKRPKRSIIAMLVSIGRGLDSNWELGAGAWRKYRQPAKIERSSHRRIFTRKFSPERFFIGNSLEQILHSRFLQRRLRILSSRDSSVYQRCEHQRIKWIRKV